MQSLIKLAAWMAPVFLLALVIVLAQLNRYDAEMAAEVAQFDQEWAVNQSYFAKNTEVKKFWKEQQSVAVKRLEVSTKKQAMLNDKIDQQSDNLEKTLKEMEMEVAK